MTEGKETPEWLTPENLTQLNHLADFTMKLMYNTKEKKRITAGQSMAVTFTDTFVLHERKGDRGSGRIEGGVVWGDFSKRVNWEGGGMEGVGMRERGEEERKKRGRGRERGEKKR